MIGAKGEDSCGEVAAMLRPRNEVRRLKVAPRKAKPFAEINSGVIKIGRNMYITSLEKPTKIPTILYGHPLYLYYRQKTKRNNFQITLVKL
ncbi:hypothetical protein [Sutcliffiella horikoshii]|uniref:hypothetical protein n=1 Tax=Sutcliffiella horikoshii TaxID=79883 RepID=UPI003CF4E374